MKQVVIMSDITSLHHYTSARYLTNIRNDADGPDNIKNGRLVYIRTMGTEVKIKVIQNILMQITIDFIYLNTYPII